MLIAFFASGCTQNTSTVNEKLTGENSFVHLVYLNLKDSLSIEEIDGLITELNRLGQIQNISQFRIGSFKDLGDKRALSEYEMIMQMTFANKAQYDLYQKDPLHDDVKKATAKFLEGPPATYDYMIR